MSTLGDEWKYFASLSQHTEQSVWCDDGDGDVFLHQSEAHHWFNVV